MNDKLYVWLTVIGAVVLAALTAFFNTLFRLPMKNKSRIDKMEERLNYALKAIEREQNLNKESHKAILKALEGLQENMTQILVRLGRLEEEKDNRVKKHGN